MSVTLTQLECPGVPFSVMTFIMVELHLQHQAQRCQRHRQRCLGSKDYKVDDMDADMDADADMVAAIRDTLAHMGGIAQGNIV
jgi:hypothetical protein